MLEINSHLKFSPILHLTVAICGQISHYHQTPSTAIESVPLFLTVLRKQVRIEGFMTGRWPDWSEAHEAIAAWLTAGDVRAPEQWTRGIESAPDAFFALYRRENVGKMLVRIHDE